MPIFCREYLGIRCEHVRVQQNKKGIFVCFGKSFWERKDRIGQVLPILSAEKQLCFLKIIHRFIAAWLNLLFTLFYCTFSSSSEWFYCIPNVSTPPRRARTLEGKSVWINFQRLCWNTKERQERFDGNVFRSRIQRNWVVLYNLPRCCVLEETAFASGQILNRRIPKFWLVQNIYTKFSIDRCLGRHRTCQNLLPWHNDRWN